MGKELKIKPIEDLRFELEEPGNKGDWFDLEKIKQDNYSSLRNLINENKDKIIKDIWNENKQFFEADAVNQYKIEKNIDEKLKDFEVLKETSKQELNNAVLQQKNDSDKQLNELQNQIKLLKETAEQSKENAVLQQKSESDKQLNELQNQIKLLNETTEQEKTNAVLQQKSESDKKLNELQNEIQLLKGTSEQSKANAVLQVKNDSDKQLNELQNQIKLLKETAEQSKANAVLQQKSESDKKVNELENKVQELNNRIESNIKILNLEHEKKISELNTEKDKDYAALLNQRNATTIKTLGNELENKVLKDLKSSKDENEIIDHIKPGQEGGDIVYTVFEKDIKESAILELKNVVNPKDSSSFKNSWITKIKTDALLVKADIMIIVTECSMERWQDDLPFFKYDKEESLFIVRPYYIVFFLKIVKTFLLKKIEIAKRQNDDSGEKLKQLEELTIQFKEISNTYVKKTENHFKQISTSTSSIIKSSENIQKATDKIQEYIDKEIIKKINEL